MAARGELEAERGDDGHFYADAFGRLGVPFLVGFMTHGAVRLSVDDAGALRVDHAQSLSGAVLLLGLFTVDRERLRTGRFRRVSYKPLQLADAVVR